ncbi:MAG: histidinol dehydrogenase [Proteobacteria bacterium]|uniref:Histidinol dehydrogenase n=1 Tax=Candidatus Avisuccinivibrio stercorigallinarum TaxID=2840704 RepID=A0A9D9GQF2_9GAMM|nr:histidinol dehydrogenase [Candidatus Avisuccinivibrio stercorigallinarum]
MQLKVWQDLSEAERLQALTRPAQDDGARVRGIVEEIIARIKQEGDEALHHYSKTLDHFEGENIELTAAEIEAACAQVDKKLKAAIDQAYKNIKAFHKAQKPTHVKLETFPGITCRTAAHAIESVGLYVPGGSAPLVSTALMLAVPAKIAGCQEIILCSPPPINPAIIYAAVRAGVRRIFNLGGAQAIAAMAYGTQSVPKVLKIFGPGNQFVTMAKRLVSDDAAGAAIDMPAGPSEVLVIADKHANPRFVAADLLSQAEHGPDSQVLLLSDSRELIEAALKAADEELETLPRKAIAEKSLAKSSAILCEDLQQCVEISNRYAPEHLILQTQNAKKLLPSLHNAGSIFVGAFTPESLGDYASGTNHTLPTYGYAKTCSALGTDDYRRRYTIQFASERGLKGIGHVVQDLAAAESLQAHRNAVTVRLEEIEKRGRCKKK